MGFNALIKNYVMRNDVAYTEDSVLIYNIFIADISRKVKKKEALEYFGKFGAVKKLHLFGVWSSRKRSQRNSKAGYVNFYDPKAAASALECNNHEMQGKHFTVRASNTWLQPEIIDFYDINVQEGLDIYQNHFGKLNILHLNDYCLEYIFDELELREQIDFAYSCFRLLIAFRRYSKLKYKVLDVTALNSMTLWQLRLFFILCGEYINEISGSFLRRNRGVIIRYLCEFCPNILTIELEGSFKASDYLLPVFCSLTNITKLSLEFCKITDFHILIISTLPNLVHLSIKYNEDVTGVYLRKLVNIKELLIGFCSKIHIHFFVLVCRALKKLETLDIRGCKFLYNTFIFDDMIEHCQSLKKLKLSGYSHIDYCFVARLNNLSNFYLDTRDILQATQIENLMRDLVKYKADKMEYLDFFGLIGGVLTISTAKLMQGFQCLKVLKCPRDRSMTDEILMNLAKIQSLEQIYLEFCTSITTDGMLSFINICKTIRQINFWGCYQFNDRFIFETIKLLKAQIYKRWKPLSMNFVETGIKSAIHKNPELLSATQFFQLNLKPFKMRYKDFCMEHLQEFFQDKFLEMSTYEINEDYLIYLNM